ncbi:MAG: hypothetical protein M3437_03195 [Chloroflexota bacterium]|nr:hypothetical protein [Chloroflexota bacterium]MDQ5867932.1 hypothetical protein [Chloroflexota bacterium]
MFDWRTEMAMQRQREMLHDAQQYRLIAEAYGGEQERSNWRSRALCSLGARLVSVGRWLQSRSGVTPAPGGSLVFLAGSETAVPRQNGRESLRKVA